MTLPLSGLLVVSVEQAVAAPTCTCRLADAGAPRDYGAIPALGEHTDAIKKEFEKR